MASTLSSLSRQLSELGLAPGDMVMVHGALRTIGPVVGGAATVVRALMETIGNTGTLVAYVDFEPFFEEQDTDVPVFDKYTARAALDHGVLHEVIRTWPGAMRSDHPDAGVCAIGAKAEWLTADHPFEYGYGPGSPFEKLYNENAKIAMLGAPLDTISMFHYAEHIAALPGKRVHRYRRLMPGGGGPQWVQFEEFDTASPVHDLFPQNCFEIVAGDFLASGKGRSGSFGLGPGYVFASKALVDFGVQWMERCMSSSRGSEAGGSSPDLTDG